MSGFFLRLLVVLKNYLHSGRAELKQIKNWFQDLRL